MKCISIQDVNTQKGKDVQGIQALSESLISFEWFILQICIVIFKGVDLI